MINLCKYKLFQLPTNPKEWGFVKKISGTYALNTLDESIRELRRVAHNMMPDSLTRYGLKVSLTDFCNSIPGAEFHYFGNEKRLEPKLEVMIYRTTHELVNNALKHADAEHITVQVVQDDGKGFDPAVETKGAGLKNIRNRAASYNGQLSIWSRPGEGTEINIEFQLRIRNYDRIGNAYVIS